MKLRHIAYLLVLVGCPEPATPIPTPDASVEPPPPLPTATPTASATAKPVVLPPPGTRTNVAEKKINDSWDKMLAGGGKLFVLTEVNKWTTGPMYVPAARLWSAPIAGGELTKIIELEGLASLAADESSLYVAVNHNLTTPPGTPTGRIVRLPLTGGTPVDVAKGIEPRVMGIDGDTLWFDGSRMPKDGHTPPQASGLPTPLFAIAFDDDNVYVTAGRGPSDPPKPNKNGRILKMPKKGGAPVVLASGLPDEPAGLAIDATHVYVSAVSWGTEALSQQGIIARVPKAGGPLETLATEQPALRTAWLSGDHVYARSGRPGRPGAIVRVAKTGGAVEQVIKDEAMCFATMDATSLYVSTDGTFQQSPWKQLSPAIVFRVIK